MCCRLRTPVLALELQTLQTPRELVLEIQTAQELALRSYLQMVQELEIRTLVLYSAGRIHPKMIQKVH
jgi:hypothetical protein